MGVNRRWLTKDKLKEDLVQAIKSAETVLSVLGYPSIYVTRMLLKKRIRLPGFTVRAGGPVYRELRKIPFVVDILIRKIISLLPRHVRTSITQQQRHAIATRVIDPLLGTRKGIAFVRHLFDTRDSVMDANYAYSLNIIVVPLMDVLTLDQLSQTVSFLRETIRTKVLGKAVLSSHKLNSLGPAA